MNYFSFTVSSGKLPKEADQNFKARTYALNQLKKLIKNKGATPSSMLPLLLAACGGGGATPSPSTPPVPLGPDFTESPIGTFTARDDANLTLDQGSATTDLTVNSKGGNDTITTGSGHDVIDGGAGSDTITAGDGNDIIRANLGADSIDAGAGDDIIVVVGTTGAGEYVASSITNPAGSGLDVSSVLTLAKLNNHASSDAEAGETIDGGTGNDTLIIYGTVDLTGVTILNITTVYVNSDVTFDISQLSVNGGSIEIIQGDGGSIIRIISTNSEPISINFTALNITNVTQLNLGENITLIVDSTSELLDAGIHVVSGAGTLQHTSLLIDQTGLVLEDTVIVKDFNGALVSDASGAIVAADGDYTSDGEVNDAPTAITLESNTISENDNGAIIGTVAVTDSDEVGSDWNSYSYSLSDDRFEIVGGQLKLKDNVSLNFEVENTVDVTVTATGAGAAAYEISQTFSIIVTDVNDPITAVLLDGGTVPISVGTLGAFIGTLSIQDEDVDDTFTFQLLSIGDSTNYLEAITIDADGDVWVSANFNLSVPTTFNVEVTSSAGDTFTKTFSIVQGTDSSIITYSQRGPRENDDTSTPLVAADLDYNNEFTGVAYEITGGDDGALFEMIGSEIYFTSGVALDYETQDTFFVEVMATQGVLVEKKLIQINIADDNDAAVLSTESNPLTVASGVNAAIVGIVPIVDPDTNSIYRDYIFQIDDGRFEIDTSGIISLVDGVTLTEAVGDTITVTITLNEQNGTFTPLDQQYTITVVPAENNNFIASADADVFVFDGPWGNDTVTDFEDGIDLLDFSASTLIFADLTITQSGADTLVEDANGNSIILTGITSTDITADDFIF